MTFGFLAARTSERWSLHGTLLLGLALCAAGAGGLLATAALNLPVTAVIASLLALVSGVAATTPPATSLALSDYPEIAGTASSFLGVARFAFGGLAAPLVGLGNDPVLALALVTAAGCALAVGTHAATSTAPRRTADDRSRAAAPVAASPAIAPPVG